MIKACLVVSKLYLNNRIFAVEDKSFNRDNCLMPFAMLKRSLANMGCELATQDIRWFEQNHPECFDLYGFGWNELLFRGRGFLSRYAALRFINKFFDIFAPKFPSYRGTVTSKFNTLKQYKFSICYENARDIPGYITEKIFDCFSAGCIPVYWGANNITDFIPEECFIDKRKFSCYEDLFSYLNKLSDEDCKGYVQAINKFIKSHDGQKFSASYFGENIATEVLKAVNPGKFQKCGSGQDK